MKSEFEKLLCVIPARGGSVGIPKKNLRLLYGVPLVEHSIQHALDAGIPNAQIVVSSDDPEVLNIANQKGVVAHHRPSELCTNTASTESALLDAVKADDSWVEHILLLQPTSPIRFPKTVLGFIEFYFEEKYDSALTTTQFHDFFWSWDKHDDHSGPAGSWEPSYNVVERPRRQELAFTDDEFFDNGNMYLTRRSVLEKKKSRLGGHVGVYPISELEGMQIDTPFDLALFQAIFDGEVPKLIGW